jgi:hypothetical protein
MSINPYFTQGTPNEQYLIEDLIIESLRIYGQLLYYIPRSLVSKDDILGEDRLSEFKNSFPIEMYFENVDSFDGQGAFLGKFGLMMEQSATLVVSRRRWEQLIGRFKTTIIPNRPNEGDLLYFPLSGGLFEIKFCKHQDAFYQLGKLYTYSLQVELFQYSSERIDTGIEEVDVFETLKTFSTDLTRTKYGAVSEINMTTKGSGYTYADVNIISDHGNYATATANIVSGQIDSVTVTNGGCNYTEGTAIEIVGNGINATASAIILLNIDNVESYGDNNKFQSQSDGFIFNENNPFGDS